MKTIELRFDSNNAYRRFFNAMVQMPNGKGITMGIVREGKTVTLEELEKKAFATLAEVEGDHNWARGILYAVNQLGGTDR